MILDDIGYWRHSGLALGNSVLVFDPFKQEVDATSSSHFHYQPQVPSYSDSRLHAHFGAPFSPFFFY